MLIFLLLFSLILGLILFEKKNEKKKITLDVIYSFLHNFQLRGMIYPSEDEQMSYDRMPDKNKDDGT